MFQYLENDEDNQSGQAELGLDDDSVWENLDADKEEQVSAITARICQARVSRFARTLQLVVKDGMGS